MALSVQHRCTVCDEHFQPTTATPCPVCGSSEWERCVVESSPTNIPDRWLHPTGVAYFALDEAARVGIRAPAWATAGVPAASPIARRGQLETRLAGAIAANATYLGIANPSTAQNLAQIRALTRQISALLRIQRGAFDAVD